jgi:carbon storage regulator
VFSKKWNSEMLILTRKESEQICLGDNIVVTVVRLAGDKVRIGVIAPADVKVIRSELKEEDVKSIPLAMGQQEQQQRKAA